MNRLNSDDMTRIRNEINALFERKLNRMTITELFLEIDRSGTKKIGLFDLKNYLLENKISVKDQDLILFLQMLDSDNDTFIDIDEFYGYVIN
jgi:Ca2+-binding EF-hand superfamily protein